MKKNRLFTTLLASALAVMSLSAQKKPLDHTVYDSWKSLANVSVSDDGKYAASLINPQEGDGQLWVRELKNQNEYTLLRAYKYAFTPDGKYVIAQIKASFADLRSAKIKKVAEHKMPKDSLAIIRLSDFSKTIIPNVKDYSTGKDFTEYIAYRLDDSLKVDKKNPKPYTLVIRNIKSGKEDSTKYVLDYTFSKNGKALALNIKPDTKKDSLAKNRIEVADLTKFNKRVISQGQTEYKQISVSETGANIAFLATTDSLKKEIKDYALYRYASSMDSARLLINKYSAGMPNDWTVSENYMPAFSKDEKRLILGTAPIVLPKDTTIPDFEKARLDIWHWNRPQTPPQELVNLEKKRKQTYLAYVDLTSGKFNQLATEEIPDVRISDENNGRYAIGISNLPYMLESQWVETGWSTYDIWVFDLEKGTNKKIKTALNGALALAPKGNYMAWYNYGDRQYYAYSFATGDEQCLTKGLNVNFWDEKNDTPTEPSPYGFAAWTENDDALLVYDPYDVWKLDPTAKKQPVNLTEGKGRADKISLRYIQTDPESRFITAKDEILLSAFSEVTKKRGFYKIANNKVLPLVVSNYYFFKPSKAKNKNVFLYSKGNFESGADLYLTADDWKTETKLTDINPQKNDYNWGTAELVSWTTYDNNKTSEGILYKPENFDPTKKYPMMVYFYEKMSDELYAPYNPVPSRSIINFPFYASRGYLVFVPDITYTTGHPGESAYNYIVSGVEKMSKNSWVDKENIAIQGQSWGGYQVSYLVTRTNMFKAAGAGAPVSNMFSAYGGIRWGTGNSRQYQYERGQSRIGATIWEAPQLYVENSPVFHADKVNTPLLIMHNDQDDAVPWYQGIEYFMALRRLQKPVWMLQYNGEKHNLRERRNSKDLSVRLQQFFDHYLKGEPMPVWMKEGIPAVKKDRTYGFELEE